MPPSTNLATYTDVYSVLEKALDQPPIHCGFTSSGKARHFLMRVNTFLKLLREYQASQTGNPLAPTKYDGLEPHYSADHPNHITIRIRETPTVTDAEGNLVELTSNLKGMFNEQPTKADPILDLEDIAEKFARSNGIKTKGDTPG